MVIAGGAIYVIFRSNIIFFDWIPSAFIDTLNYGAQKDLSLVEYFIIYSLPDALWYGALLLTESCFLDSTTGSKCIFGVGVLLPFALELAQIQKDVPGTFDMFDILAYLLTLTIFIILNKPLCVNLKFKKHSSSNYW